MRLSSVSSVLAIVVLLAASAAQADFTVTVPNGDFTSPTVPADPGWQDGAVPTDWTASGGAGYGMQLYSGGQLVYLAQNHWTADNSVLQQTDIGTNVNALTDKYTLKFDFGSAGTGAGWLNADLLVDGNAVATKTINWNSGIPLATYSLDWTANATGALGIRFTGDGMWKDDNPFTQIQLAKVGLSYVATPEPSTLILISTGLMGLLAYAWRKRK